MIGNERQKSNGSSPRKKIIRMSAGGIISVFLRVVYLDKATMAMVMDTQMDLQVYYIPQSKHVSETREHNGFISIART